MSGEEMTKSALARLQVTGMFQSTARSSALTSGSCGCGRGGSQYRHVSGWPSIAGHDGHPRIAIRDGVAYHQLTDVAVPLAPGESVCLPQRKTKAARITEDGVMTASSAIWRDQLTDQERATLGRGDGVIADPRPDVLVVGGGILGVATAAACHDAGLGSVLLIETGHLGAGATGGATGLLIPEPHQWSDPEPFVDLERASLERWRDLEQTVPGGVGLVELDWIGLAPSSGGFAAHQPPAIQWLSPGQVEQLIPGLARPMEGALIRRQARLNPLRAVARLAARLPAVATGVAATAVTVRGTRITSVATSAGDVQPGAVVFATGLPPVLDGLPLRLPSDRVKGHLLVTEPAPVQLPGIVAPIATQIEDGRLLAGGTFDVGDESPAVQPEVIDAIMAGLAATLPALRGLGIAYQWCCFRPRHPDRRPVIDRVPGLENAWLTSGHFRTGILNAPMTAAVLARWIGGGGPPAEPATWAASRFASRTGG
ncbi:MAG TPA: FAD-binding oxidoreductase [Streptosporangiaceae bacterium]|nr:FAD-binding oxidoreductase [Streptosporangiaceae bacterium]